MRWKAPPSRIFADCDLVLQVASAPKLSYKHKNTEYRHMINTKTVLVEYRNKTGSPGDFYSRVPKLVCWTKWTSLSSTGNSGMKMETYLTSVFIRHTPFFTQKNARKWRHVFPFCVYPTSCFQKKNATSRQDDKLAIGWIQNWREKKKQRPPFCRKRKKILLDDFFWVSHT